MKGLFKWIFKSELKELQSEINNAKHTMLSIQEKEKKLSSILGNIDVSVDVHRHSPSWAVISIQGHKSDYIKFIDLGQRDIIEIQAFLRNFDRRKVDASPRESNYLKFY